jgi:hypothetical protein
VGLNVPIPADAVLNTDIGIRFRLSSDPAFIANMLPTGEALDGEVEDYIGRVRTIDYGDLPPVYATACHEIVTGLKIGAAIDAELTAQPDVAAAGDDNNGAPDDEDGIAAFPEFEPGADATVQVFVMNMLTSGDDATLYGFIDWNNDGTFDDPGETVSVAVPNGTNGTLGLTFNVPANAVVETDLGARFRLSTDAALGASGVDCAPDGEVEDYLVRANCIEPETATATLKECTLIPGMAMADFTLTDADASVDPAGTNTVTYHNSLSDAHADINPLTSPYSSTTANVWVRVEDPATGCYSVDIVQLVVNPLPIAQAAATAVTCPGNNDGAVSVTPTSGQPDFTYLWNDPSNATTANVTGLAAGTYTVTVTDGNGCTTTATATVTETAPPALSVNSAVICLGGSVDLNTLVNNTGGGTLSFHQTQSDAENNLNPLTNSVVSPDASRSYFVRSQVVNQGVACYTVLEIRIRVRPVRCGSIIVTGPN